MTDEHGVGGNWQVSRDLTLRFAGTQLTASASSEWPVLPLECELVPLLEPFAAPCSIEDGIREFVSRFEGAEDRTDLIAELVATIRQFQAAGILVPAGDDAAPVSGWYSRAEGHVLMLSDQNRTLSYRSVLQRHAPGKIVAEIGCGSGVIACFAALAGAEHVFAIEETEIVELAKEIAALNGLSERITFIVGNSLDVRLPQPADIVCSELMATDPLAENILPVLADARNRHLKPGGQMIPSDVSIWAVGLDAPTIRHRDYMLDQKRHASAELSNAYGLNLEPLISLYEHELEHRRSLAFEHNAIGEFVTSNPVTRPETILTDEQCLVTFTLGDEDENLPMSVAADFTATTDGVHNGMLTYFKSSLDPECTINTGPYSPERFKNWQQMLAPLPDLRVSVADRVPITAHIDAGRRPNVVYTRDP